MADPGGLGSPFTPFKNSIDGCSGDPEFLDGGRQFGSGAPGQMAQPFVDGNLKENGFACLK